MLHASGGGFGGGGLGGGGSPPSDGIEGAAPQSRARSSLRPPAQLPFPTRAGGSALARTPAVISLRAWWTA
eukprot:5637994-Prymnesium_polylepis.1